MSNSGSRHQKQVNSSWGWPNLRGIGLRLILKRLVQGSFLVAVLPLALLSGFGRIMILQALFAQLSALVPGFIGIFWRAAFYKLTLDDCSIDVVIAFGSFFSRRQVTIEPNTSIGSYCVIGRARIGTRTQISSHVEIPGRGLQHLRDGQGRLSSSVENSDDRVTIGADCWIGASAIIMANVGSQTTIGAGSVVTRDIPAGVVAVGAPAKPIKRSQPQADEERGGDLADL